MFQTCLVLAPDRRSDCKCCKVLTFPCPTSCRPEQLAQLGMTKLRHCQPMYFVFNSAVYDFLQVWPIPGIEAFPRFVTRPAAIFRSRCGLADGSPVKTPCRRLSDHSCSFRALRRLADRSGDNATPCVQLQTDRRTVVGSLRRA